MNARRSIRAYGLLAAAAALLAMLSVNALTAQANPHKTSHKVHRAKRAKRAHTNHLRAGMTTTQIATVARNFAAAAGDPSPTSIRAVRTTRGAANLLLSGASVSDASHDVYAIVETGNFTIKNLPIPPNAPAPRGTVLHIVVDASTGEMLDEGVNDIKPDLATLGSVLAIG